MKLSEAWLRDLTGARKGSESGDRLAAVGDGCSRSADDIDQMSEGVEEMRWRLELDGEEEAAEVEPQVLRTYAKATVYLQDELILGDIEPQSRLGESTAGPRRYIRRVSGTGKNRWARVALGSGFLHGFTSSQAAIPGLPACPGPPSHAAPGTAIFVEACRLGGRYHGGRVRDGHDRSSSAHCNVQSGINDWVQRMGISLPDSQLPVPVAEEPFSPPAGSSRRPCRSLTSLVVPAVPRRHPVNPINASLPSDHVASTQCLATRPSLRSAAVARAFGAILDCGAWSRYHGSIIRGYRMLDVDAAFEAVEAQQAAVTMLSC
ncbi:hypothetical protein G7046_g7495 [Stylonectria norvegica]|nr:hypothetical protein G7046_g7495 [Stylonectria norvegica]